MGIDTKLPPVAPFGGTAQPSDPTSPEAIGRLLNVGFGVSPAALDRIPLGQVTVNYRATTDNGLLFVKSYPPGTDLAHEAAGIRLSTLAAEAGVPVARPLARADGTFIAELQGSAASLWEFVDGQIADAGFTHAQRSEVGRTLGLIHRAFAQLPESSGPAPQAARWLEFDAPGFIGTIDRLLGVIESRDELDEFDQLARHTLRERRDQVRRIPGLLAELPPLTTQVLHGDYSVMNVLFNGEYLAAVIDFRPPDQFFIAYELGRIAYDPRTVTDSPRWQTDASSLIAAYRETNPGVAPDGIAQSARVALLQLLTSLYGVKNHYLKPGLLQADLDAFWLLRHSAAITLLDHLAAVEKMLES